MNNEKIIEPTGYIVAAVTAVFSFILFYIDTSLFFGSIFAALEAAGLMWVTYVILRVCLLAIRRK